MSHNLSTKQWALTNSGGHLSKCNNLLGKTLEVNIHVHAKWPKHRSKRICGWSTSVVPAFPDDIGRQAGQYVLLRHCIKKLGLPLHHHTRATIDDSHGIYQWFSCCIWSPFHNFTKRKTTYTRILRYFWNVKQCWQQLLNKALLLATPIHTATTNIHPSSPYIYEP